MKNLKASKIKGDNDRSSLTCIDRIPDDIERAGPASRSDTSCRDDRSIISRLNITQTLRTVAQATSAFSRNLSFPVLICLLGLIASGSLLAVGITGAQRDQDEQFQSLAKAVVQELNHSWRDYENAALWMHEVCGRENMTRITFREAYEHLQAEGLHFRAVECIPNVTHAKRSDYEAEAETWYAANYPEFPYNGFKGYELDLNDPNSTRSQQDFYFPVHYVEPFEGNEAAVDFDLYSDPSRRTTIESALTTWKPALSSRVHLFQGINPSHYSVLLMHPGIPLSTQPDLKPFDLSLLVIRIHDLLELATKLFVKPMKVYVYDTTSPDQSEFLGAVVVNKHGVGSTEFLPEIELEELRSSAERCHEEIEKIATSRWTVVVAATHGTFEPVILFVVVGGILMMLGCVCLAVWVYTNLRQQAKLAQIRQHAEGEKAALIVEGVKKVARNERELNDFIAHEVRNPLSAAMSACSFVSSAMNDETVPFTEARTSINEDLDIIDSSLAFINDLLRNMLDMQRAKSKQLNIDWAPVDLMEDVLKPVDAMLYRRGGDVRVETVCPPNLVIMSDRLRLKQIALNLARNSVKFVEHGFIRLSAAVMLDGTVSLFIEDSGPGIPIDKQKKLFAKFQESLDALNQGTGIGLSLCLNLVELMGGTIALDNMYDSGVPGCPGSRFVIHLKKPPISMDDVSLDSFRSGSFRRFSMLSVGSNQYEEMEPELPVMLSVLFVDDDIVLRKLFSRSIRRICPEWNTQEASNGESAIVMVEGCVDKSQLIFVDQYMASVEKQLLGTETVRALRAAGCKAVICGLSANDVQKAFEDAGANAFMIKPFPTKADCMKNELLRILDGYEASGMFDMSSKDGLEPVEEGLPFGKEEGKELEKPVGVVMNGMLKEDGKPMAIEHIQVDMVDTARAMDKASNCKRNPAA